MLFECTRGGICYVFDKIVQTYIRAPVGADVIPRTKILETSPRTPSQALKTHQEHFSGLFLAQLVHTRLLLCTREPAHTRFRDLYDLLLQSKHAMSLPELYEALTVSLNVSKGSGDVHGYQAIVFLLPHISMVDHGARHGRH